MRRLSQVAIDQLVSEKPIYQRYNLMELYATAMNIDPNGYRNKNLYRSDLRGLIKRQMSIQNNGIEPDYIDLSDVTNDIMMMLNVNSD